MRLVTYDRGGARRLGAWAGQQVVDLPQAVGHPAFPTTMEALVARHGGSMLEAARDAMSIPSYVEEALVGRGPRILPPIIPISLLEQRWILGPDDRLPWPPDAEEIDYSLEIACVVGRAGRDLSPDEAAASIFGYTVMNDWSLRGVTEATDGRREWPVVRRFATSLGPCLVTPDEFDPSRGRLMARVDGDVWSEGSLGDATGTFADLIAALSKDQDLYPGDVVGSGSFPGGCALDLGKRLPPGATVELEAEGIGVLRNRVGFPAAGRAA
jgi:2-keto-4-pentenoate hydratase/2-oxohepta-3-ene-1,7-dioic acid hydratase in catechol pathway